VGFFAGIGNRRVPEHDARQLNIDTQIGKHEVLRDGRVSVWDDMSTGRLCELFHTVVIFSGLLYAPHYSFSTLDSDDEEGLDLTERNRAVGHVGSTVCIFGVILA
jgi:hypothetical protein